MPLFFAIIPHSPHGMLTVAVMDHFEGHDFEDEEPTDNDLRNIFSYLGKIHTINFPTMPVDDGWSPTDLAREYKLRGNKIDQETKILIEPVIRQMEALDLSTATQGFCHGDMHKANVLKNAKGYAIIDWSLANNGPYIVDVATALAHFCTAFDDPVETQRKIDLALDAYKQIKPLPENEEQLIPLLMKATFANFVLQTKYLQTAKNDTSKQTTEWLEFGSKGLKLAKKLK